MHKILLIVEHVEDSGEIKPATLNTVTAACQISSEVHLLTAGEQTAASASAAAKIAGVDIVLQADSAALRHAPPENLAPFIADLVREREYTHVLAPATTFGKNLMPAVAALLDVMQVSDISEVHSPDTFERPIYAGNALAKVRSTDPVKIITVRPTKFTSASPDGGLARIETLAVDVTPAGLSVWQGLESVASAGPELTTAKVVVSGGRGLGSAENFKMLGALAEKLDGALGASRAAVDAGYAPNDWQVGQTGKVVAPDVYFAVGISGAIQHLAGIKDARFIIAINKDPEAPIFQHADYGLVADLLEALPQLQAALDG